MKLAVENTKRLFPPVVKTMSDVMRELFPPEDSAFILNEILDEELMWIISNDRRINGAISMLYEDKLHKLALEVDDDLYIFPSSTHEVIAIRASMGDPYGYADMVAQINMTEVVLEERLSNQVYRYDKDLRKLTLATDTPNKRLDGAEADSE